MRLSQYCSVPQDAARMRASAPTSATVASRYAMVGMRLAPGAGPSPTAVRPQQQTAHRPDESQDAEERGARDRWGGAGVSDQREREAQDESVHRPGTDRVRPRRSIPQSQRGEAPGGKGPPLQGQGMGRGPAEQEPEYDCDDEPWHSTEGSHLTRKEQLVAVGIVDLEHIVAPPGFLAGNRALGEFTAKVCEPVRGQLDEQARLASTRGVLAEDDLAFAAIDLADRARAVAFMPAPFEAEHVDVETNGAVHVGDEEDRARVPPVNRWAARGLLRHAALLIRLADGALLNGTVTAQPPAHHRKTPRPQFPDSTLRRRSAARRGRRGAPVPRTHGANDPRPPGRWRGLHARARPRAAAPRWWQAEARQRGC